MNQVGIVRKLDGKTMELEVRRVSACGGNCGGCGSSCGTGSMHSVKLDNKLDAKVGDVVELEAKPSEILKYTAAIYIVPLIMLIIGVFIGSKVSDNELVMFGLGMGFLLASGIIIKLIDNYIKREDKQMLTATKIL